MNTPNKNSGHFLTRPLRLVAIGVVLAVFPLLLVFSSAARKNAANQVIDWLPAGHVETQQFFDFLLDFNEGELLMISWDGATVENPVLDQIAQVLASPTPDGEPAYFQRVTTSRELRRRLTEPPLNLSENDAQRRLAGWMTSRDGGDGCIVAIISGRGSTHRGEAIAYVDETVKRLTGLRDDQIQIAGPSIDSVAIDQITASSQRLLLPIFLVVCFALLMLALRNVFAAVIIFFVAAASAELGPALIHLTGCHMDSISLLIGSLVYVLTISMGVHLANYYRETVREGYASSAPRETLRRAFVPCSLATLTTVLGLASLVASQMVPIRSFGIFASAALVLATIALFIFFASVTQEVPLYHSGVVTVYGFLKSLTQRHKGTKNFDTENMEERKDTEDITSKSSVFSCVSRSLLRAFVPSCEQKRTTKPQTRSVLWERVAHGVHRRRRIIVALSLLSMVAACLALPRLNTSVTFHGMFDSGVRVIRDYNALEERFGGLIPLEVVIAVPLGSQPSSDDAVLNELWLIQDAVERLASISGVDSTISALNFLPSIPPRNSRATRSAIQRSVIQSVLPRHLDSLEEIGFLKRRAVRSEHRIADEELVDTGNGVALWRISLRIPAGRKVNYDVLLSSIRGTLSELASRSSDLGFTRIGTLVTGGVPLAHEAQSQLLRDLIQSFLMAFGTITLTMIILLRSVVRGLIAMIPNIFPCLIIFGAMAWWNCPIDIGSMMTASVAMGIAVDGTLHFITWFRLGMQRGLSRLDAVTYAYQQCATALTQTTFICGLGMLVFCWSEFLPIARFSTLLCALLFAALVGDLVILPAILSGRWGKMFEK
ncbi:MAG: efflux RND transporter permease subunit [Thermoguttaceae bacterium]